MRHRDKPRHNQRGAALFALLIFLLLAGSYGIYRHTNQGYSQVVDAERLQLRLARAKEALLAYAVTDDSRPGRFPCPDTAGNGTAPLLTRDDCDSYRGGLPWKTLDLIDADDGFARPFQYALSPLFGGDRTAPPLNSDTVTALGLDIPVGAASNDIVAVVIAGRGPLDIRNADNDDYYFRGSSPTADGSASTENNDEIIAITRQELMAAVELRIANQLRTCLTEHANSPDNLQQTYPWPAPLSSKNNLGTTKSLFGMVPSTQPGNPETSLKAVNVQLANLKIALNSASTVADRIPLLLQLQEQAAYAGALFNTLYLSALDLNDQAGAARTAFEALDSTLVTATATKDTYSAASASLPSTFTSAMPSLSRFRESLVNSGFDLFINELQSQNQAIRTRIDQITDANGTSSPRFDLLITPVNALKNALFDNSLSSNPSIEARLTASDEHAIAAASAINLARKSLTSPNPENAIAEANALHAANVQLETAILTSRVNIDPNELAVRIVGLESALSRLAISSGTEDLLRNLNSSSALIATLISSAPAINAAKVSTLGAVASAIGSLSANDQSAIRTRTETAITEIKSLKALIEAIGDNIAKDSLAAVNGALEGFQSSAPANVTAARNARTPVKSVIYWADLAIGQTADIARLAKRGVNAQEDHEASAYVAASRLLSSLDGSTGSISLLQKAATDNSPEALAKGQAAYETSLTNLDTLTRASGTLDTAVQTSLATAGQPTVWYGKACAFLKPATGSKKGWWEANEWRKLFFYQITDRVRPTVGSLLVNGAGNYPVVAVAAGKALAIQPTPQNRANRRALDYLEKANGDPSRDGDAQAPSKQFIGESVSASFNDRLAY